MLELPRKFLFNIFILMLISSTFYLPKKIAAEEETTKTFNVEEFGANGADAINDAAAIQKALDQADGVNKILIQVPDGDYYLNKTLRIGSNTHLKLSEHANFIRNGNFSPMIVNNTGLVKSEEDGKWHLKWEYGYEGNHDITIEGGTWEGNSDQFPSNFNHITIGHAENIFVQNTELLHSYGTHDIEFAGVRNGKILNNKINGYSGPKKEAIQLDIVHSTSNFPAFGEYDNTPCDHILIEGNSIENHSVGIGNHNNVKDVYQTNIKIYNNHFKGIQNEGIDALNFNNLDIRNNVFENVGLGIQIRMNAGKPDKANIDIGNNQIFKTKSIPKTIGNGINIQGNEAYPLGHVKIKENLISGCDKNGIYLVNANHSFVIHNQVSNSGENGISIHESESNRIENNLIKNSGANGIYISENAPRQIVANNVVLNSKNNGISIHSLEGLKVYRNKIYYSVFHGIFMDKNNQLLTHPPIIENNRIITQNGYGSVQ